MKTTFSALAACALLGLTVPATAATFDTMIGDNDGYGEGIADNANVVGLQNFFADQRSPAEQAAVDGSEQTDINSALFAPVSTIANFNFTFSGVLTSATLTLDIGGVQDGVFGASTLAYFNGVLQTGMLALNQQFNQTNVLQFVLDAAQIAQANLDGYFSLTMDRNGNIDAIFMDYLRLEGVTAAVPVPAGLPLLLAGLGGLAALRRKARKAA